MACFRNVAAHLEPGGCFVIEVGVPDAPAAPARRDRPRRSPSARRGSASTRYDIARQGLVSHHYRLDVEGRLEPSSVPVPSR